MSGHHTKRATASPSQIPPSAMPKVAFDATSADRWVGLCDWHGQLVWKTGTGNRAQIGQGIWKNCVGKSKDQLKSAVASVVTLREQRMVEVEDERGEHFRLWMWPLSDPEIAICILAMPIPSELALLTDRETACLRSLAQGLSTRDISKELGIGLTTVHTHLRRSREKLGLATAEALVGFAARYFYVPPSPIIDSAATRKPSG